MIKTVDLTVTASSAYSAGNSVGGKITLEDLALPAVIKSGDPFNLAITDVVLLDKAAQAVPYDLLFFDSDLDGMVTDKAAFAVHAADLPKSLGHLSLAGLVNLGANGGIVTLSNIYKRLTLPGRTAYAVLVTRGAPTYASASDVSLRITAELAAP